MTYRKLILRLSFFLIKKKQKIKPLPKLNLNFDRQRLKFYAPIESLHLCQPKF
jgi:hypothetical protein